MIRPQYHCFNENKLRMAGRIPDKYRGVHGRDFTVLASLFIVRCAPGGLPFDQNLKLLCVNREPHII